MNAAQEFKSPPCASGYEIRKEDNGGCYSADMRASWTVYVGGNMVGFSTRKWLAKAIGEAITAGHIAPTGDTTMSLYRYANEHDRALAERMNRLPNNA